MEKNLKICGVLRMTLTASLLCPLMLSAGIPGKGHTMEKKIRRPQVAGQFYPSDPGVLRSEIEKMLKAAPAVADRGARPLCIVSPHAGYIYSGATAARGYALLDKGCCRTVVVISPCHVDFFPFSSVYDGDAYETPLGEIPVDGELAEEIASRSDLVRLGERGHAAGRNGRGEHSLEVQLPFLQVALDGFSLVPVVMGDQSGPVVEALAEALAGALEGKDALIVASTDLSHFHGEKEARRLDSVFTSELEEFDTNGIMRSLSEGSTEACGGGPAVAALLASRALGGDRCEVLGYATSGDVTGDHSSVVGYVSAAVFGDKAPGNAGGDGSASSPERDEAGLCEADRRFLLAYARKVLESAFRGEKPDPGTLPSPVLSEDRGGFVTLKERGQLRGCIGYIEPVMPLVSTVEEMARAAAFQDHRFSPLREEELPEVTIEISVLSPVVTAGDPSDIVVGKHGIIISRDGRRGLLLPQVATEWGWDRETFLSQTCVKAGLDPGAWKREGTKIEIFSAVVFSESE